MRRQDLVQPRFLWFMFLVLGASLHAIAQTGSYRAFVKNSEEVGVVGATVIALDQDSIALGVTTTDAEGKFSIGTSGAHFVRISHLAYKEIVVNLSQKPLPEVIYLEEQEELLGEVVVQVERPLMKLLEGGILQYDVALLFKESLASNAYDLLLKIPGIVEEGAKPSLIGTRSLTIVLNGKVPNMPQDQILQLLKQIPVDAVQNVEVSYTPIPKYKATGGSVNIVLKPQTTDKEGNSTFSGEVNSSVTQRRYTTASVGTYLSYGMQRLGLRGSYDWRHIHDVNDMWIGAKDVVSGAPLLTSETIGNTQRDTHTASINGSYTKGRHEISADYYISLTPNGKIIQKNKEMGIESERNTDYNHLTHHIALDYEFDNRLRIGGFYTQFHRHDLTNVTVPMSLNTPYSHYLSPTNRRNKVWGGFIQNEHELNGGWGINYGIHINQSNTDDEITYTEQEGIFTLEDAQRGYKETSLNGYVGMKKKLSEKVDLSFSVVGNYIDFKVYQKKYIVPQVQLTYMMGLGNMLQFAFDTEENYPAYWERQSFEQLRSLHQIWIGNPNLRPYTTYNSRLLYVLKGKYIFQLINSYEPNYFTQQLSYDKPNNRFVFNTQNWDYRNSLRLVSVLPFSFWQPLKHTLVLSANLQSAKADLPNGIQFDRHKVMTFVNLKNEWKVTPQIAMDLDFSLITGGIQGYYDMTDLYLLSAGAKWTSKDGHWMLSLVGNDLLNKGIPDIKVHGYGQSFEFYPPKDGRSITLQVRYHFGNFKKRAPSQLSTSRF